MNVKHFAKTHIPIIIQGQVTGQLHIFHWKIYGFSVDVPLNILKPIEFEGLSKSSILSRSAQIRQGLKLRKFQSELGQVSCRDAVDGRVTGETEEFHSHGGSPKMVG